MNGVSKGKRNRHVPGAILHFVFKAGLSKLRCMSSPKYQVRRATLDDFGQLMELWKSMTFPAEELSRRITEFQVAMDAEGKLLGAIGLQIAQRQGLIHNEGFTDFGVSDHVRPLFWERFEALAKNHGLFRLWTREEAPFWSRSGFQKPDQEALAKLPPAWNTADAGQLLTIKLKEDVEEVLSAEKEFALFMDSEKQRSARAMQQAKVLKAVATLLAIALVILVFIGAIFVMKKSPMFRKQGRLDLGKHVLVG